MHRSFESFQAIDLSLRLAVAPGLNDRVSHGVDISLQRASETLHRVQARLLGVFQLLGKGGQILGGLSS